MDGESIGMGKRAESRWQEFWVATEALADAPRHVFYDRLNALLAGAGLWSDVPPAFKGRNSHF
jgi:hypothetical protein